MDTIDPTHAVRSAGRRSLSPRRVASNLRALGMLLMTAAASLGVAAQEPVPDALCAMCHSDAAEAREQAVGGLHAGTECCACGGGTVDSSVSCSR